VETPAQLEFLREHRCEQVQGYLIGRPVSAAQLEQLIQRRTPDGAGARPHMGGE
jgi:EAL domain-containing protein (putative c-di-GMP-specific phosphodiesterase class I)